MLFETLSDIIATVSILIKFGRDDILEDKKLFIRFLNELGFKYEGKLITEDRLYNMTQDITFRQREKLISEFLVGHEPIYRKLAMYTNSQKS